MRTTLLLLLAATPILAQGALPDATVVASDAVVGGSFGVHLATSDQYLVVGAPFDDDLGSNTGSVYVFERQANGSLVELQQLYAGDPAIQTFFGSSVAVHGDRIAVGATGAMGQLFPNGAAYLFQRQGATFVQTAKLAHTNGGFWAGPEHFGTAVALDGQQVLVGGPDATGTLPHSGRVDVYEQTGLGWSVVQELYPADFGVFGIGSNMALDGDRLVLGAPEGIGGYGTLPNAPLAGSAFVFERNANGQWNQVARLASQQPLAGERLGIAVDLEGDRAVVSALGAMDPVTNLTSSSIRVFERDALGLWNEAALLPAPNPTLFGFEMFGTPLELEGDRLYALSSENFGVTTAVLLLERTAAGAWQILERLDVPSTAGFDTFGNALAVSGDRAYVADSGADAGRGVVHEYTNGRLFHGEPAISIAVGGVQTLRVRSTEYAGGIALLLGSSTGTAPGTLHGPSGITVPLNLDAFTVNALGGGVVAPLVVALDSDGRAQSTVTIPTGLPASVAGRTLHHAALFLGASGGGVTLLDVTNAAALSLVP